LFEFKLPHNLIFKKAKENLESAKKLKISAGTLYFADK